MKRIEDDATIETEAVRLADRLDDPSNLDDTERERLADFALSSATHVSHLLDELALREGFKLLRPQDERTRQARTREMLEILRNSKPMLESQPPRIRSRPALTQPWLWGMAAAVLIAVGVGLWQLLGGPATHEYSATTVAQRVDLEDGSVVDLRAGSAMNFSMSREQRVTNLLSGSARFKVSSDKARPFHVKAGKASVVATGTGFEVSVLKDGRTNVTLMEGQVLVAGSAAPDAPRILRPGDETYVSAEGHVEAVLHHFRGMKLAQVADVYNQRGRPPEFVVQGIACERDLVAALNVDDPSDLIRVLEQDEDLVLNKQPESAPAPTTVVIRMRADAAPADCEKP